MIGKKSILLLCFLPLATLAQEAALVIEGRIMYGRQGVPYATLQLMGTSIGVACNDNGEYTLKIPAGHENDTVLVRSVGYQSARVAVGEMKQKSTVKLREQTVALREVQITSFRTPQHLLGVAVEHIDSNYHQKKAWSTFFSRDWRAVDGELYLFDEAVMSIRRAPYSTYSDKRAYLFATDKREMKTNYKTLLKHRMVVQDRELVEEKIGGPEGVDEKMGYADNEEFYDPVAAPKASFALSHGTLAMHTFEPIQEFVNDDVVYYLLRSVGPCRVARATMRYEFVVRKSDLAIVRITTAMDSVNMPVGQDAWINIKYDRMAIITDSSEWNYDVRDGRYTLTRYYNNQTIGLATGDRLTCKVKQRWQQCVDWHLTDFSLEEDTVEGEVIAVRPQTVAVAFGKSDYSSDFWGQYNSIAIDALPAWLLYEKLLKTKSR